MDDSGFIVPPPGLIPARPADAGPGEQPAAPVRPLPSFTPPPGPGAPVVPPRPVWRVVLPGGRTLPVTRALLLGRNPSASAHPGDTEAVALDDPTSTVSKTHAVLVPEEGTLTVTDLHSTNGVVVAGSRAEPGVPVAVPSGAELRLGDLRLRVELA